MTEPSGPYGPATHPTPTGRSGSHRPWFKKKRFVIPGALVVLAGLGGALSDGDETVDAPLAVSSTAGAPSEPASATTTPESVTPSARESASVETTPATPPAPAPATPTPTPTPSDEPTEPEVELDPYEVRYGTFDVITESGSGDSVITVPTGLEAGLITATHSGSRNFVVQGLDDDYEMVDLYVNEIGNYSGTVDWGLTSYRDAPATLQIQADGAWTITLAPINSATDGGTAISGTGDTVVKYEGDKGLAPITHNGDSNFVVYQTDGTRPNLLLNEIGFYQGTIPIKAGPSLIIVRADGDWSITVG